MNSATFYNFHLLQNFVSILVVFQVSLKLYYLNYTILVFLTFFSYDTKLSSVFLQGSWCSPTSLSLLPLEERPGASRGERCSGAIVLPSAVTLSRSTQVAPSTSYSPGPTEPTPRQLSITLPPSSFLQQRISTRGTTAVSMRMKSSPVTSPLRVSLSQSLSKVTHH